MFHVLVCLVCFFPCFLSTYPFFFFFNFFFYFLFFHFFFQAFGELALMNEGSRRTASCIAGTNGCEMIQISRSAYQKVIAKHSIEYRPQQLHDRAKEITKELLKVSFIFISFFLIIFIFFGRFSMSIRFLYFSVIHTFPSSPLPRCVLQAEAKEEHAVLMSKLVAKAPYFNRLDKNILLALYSGMRYQHLVRNFSFGRYYFSF